MMKENYKVVITDSVGNLGIKKRVHSNAQIAKFTIDPLMTLKDGRTSLMIKNIPNKYTQKLLKETLDITHAG